jgi:hypothetical protein
MRNLDLINDAVPPILVAAVNIGAQKQTTQVLGVSIQQALNYGMTAVGYLSAGMGWGGKYSDFLKNIGIAAAPGALISLYNKVASPVPPASIQRMQRVSRYPGPAMETPFQGTRLV